MGEYWKANQNTRYTGSSGLNGNRRATMYGKTGYVNSSGNFIPDPEPQGQQPGWADAHREFLAGAQKAANNMSANSFYKTMARRRAKKQQARMMWETAGMASARPRSGFSTLKFCVYAVGLLLIAIYAFEVMENIPAFIFAVPRYVKTAFWGLSKGFSMGYLLLLLGSVLTIIAFALFVIWEIISGSSAVVPFLIIATLFIGLPLKRLFGNSIWNCLFQAFCAAAAPAVILWVLAKIMAKIHGE